MCMTAGAVANEIVESGRGLENGKAAMDDWTQSKSVALS